MSNDEKETDDWRHLLPYGYAPGHYMGRCRDCDDMRIDMDKRALRCRSCAEAKYAADVAAQKGAQP